MDENEIRKHPKTCVDCGGLLEEIKVLQGTGRVSLPFVFASKDAKMGSLSGKYPVRGFLMAFACSSCARVVFYAATYNEE
jgi:hypothetical protein